MAEHQNEIFGIGVNHAEGNQIVVVFAVDGFVLHVREEVVHPAHVPLVMETEAAAFGGPCDARETRGFFGDENRMGGKTSHDAVQVLEKFQSVVVDVAAVLIRDPFAVFFAVVQVEHARDRIDAQTVAVEFAQPIHGVGN